MADQQVTLIGACGSAPELRFTASGQAVASFSLAVSRRYKKDDEWQEVTSWFRATVWGELGEHCAQSLEKGSRVIATGRIEVRQYEDREGAQRTSVDFTVDEIGPSLRWANTVIERVERQKPTNSNYQPPDGSFEEPY